MKRGNKQVQVDALLPPLGRVSPQRSNVQRHDGERGVRWGEQLAGNGNARDKSSLPESTATSWRHTRLRDTATARVRESGSETLAELVKHMREQILKRLDERGMAGAAAQLRKAGLRQGRL